MRVNEDDTTRSDATLDPQDWQAFRARAHAMVERAVDQMEAALEGRVWTPVPEDLMAALQADLPVDGAGPNTTDAAISELMPYGVGNTHPRFFGWVHGAGTPGGLIADIAAAAMNANTGGRDHAAIHVERQIIRWVRDLFSFPENASGLVVSGTSMATIVALKVARDVALDFRSRKAGVAGGQLVGYASAEAHACNARAFDMLGLGTDALRRVPCDADLKMDVAALESMIEADRAAGDTPFVVIGTAGTVNAGSIDPLADLAALCAKQALWFHVDGAFGGAGILSDHLKPKLEGIERADSIAFDFHKWLQVNYDAGFVLVRDGAFHRRAFSDLPEYLSGVDRGLAAASPWPVEFGPELSRGFRALKVWAHLKEIGPQRLGAVVTRNCQQVEYLASCIDAHESLERMASIETSICCFRYVRQNMSEDDLDALNQEIVIRLQEAGIAAPSWTRIGGRLAIRVNITNHRTRMSDIDVLIDAIVRTAPEAASAINV
ncbi:pyridoxal-dependent decarboxylase [Henriciella sp. AS95]|uniref:pyridoxal phosphate-dependent decarboxylase family protein n=1 Tax=Henriciella sp. AS95 TaxID=3135782 RepID=UPI0031786AC0